MATVLYEYFRIQNKYFQIPLTPTMNTRIECDNVGMVTNNGDDYPGFFCYGNEWDNNTISICSLETGVSGNFVGRIKGAKCPFDLQFLTWDFS